MNPRPEKKNHYKEQEIGLRDGGQFKKMKKKNNASALLKREYRLLHNA